MKKQKRKTFSYEMIQNVKVEESPFGDNWLNFMIDQCRYIIKIQEEYDGRHRVYHREEIDNENCPLCSGKLAMCSVLTKKSDELLGVLMQHPNVRLRWLLSRQRPMK